MTAVSASITRDDLLMLRKAIFKTRESKESFEESPIDFIIESTNIDPQHFNEVLGVLTDTPKGLRCLTLDYAISLRLKDLEIVSEDDPTPVPHGPIPIPLIGVNVFAIYNALIIGNVAAYHQIGAGILALTAAVATKVVSYQGSGDIDVEGVRALPLPSCRYHHDYLSGTLHRKLVEQGFGDARERLYLRRIISDYLNETQQCCPPDAPIRIENGEIGLTFRLYEDGTLFILSGSMSEE